MDEVLEEKVVNGKKMFYVSFYGYGPNDDEWIPEDELVLGPEEQRPVLVKSGTLRGKRAFQNEPK